MSEPNQKGRENFGRRLSMERAQAVAADDRRWTKREQEVGGWKLETRADFSSRDDDNTAPGLAPLISHDA